VLYFSSVLRNVIIHTVVQSFKPHVTIHEQPCCMTSRQNQTREENTYCSMVAQSQTNSQIAISSRNSYVRGLVQCRLTRT